MSYYSQVLHIIKKARMRKIICINKNKSWMTPLKKNSYEIPEVTNMDKMSFDENTDKKITWMAILTEHQHKQTVKGSVSATDMLLSYIMLHHIDMLPLKSMLRRRTATHKWTYRLKHPHSFFLKTMRMLISLFHSINRM